MEIAVRRIIIAALQQITVQVRIVCLYSVTVTLLRRVVFNMRFHFYIRPRNPLILASQHAFTSVFKFLRGLRMGREGHSKHYGSYGILKCSITRKLGTLSGF